jgi:putative ABC transport system substrate-binding protein
LARPGGNITGLSLQQSDIAGKKLGLLREVVTGLRRLALLGNVGNSSSVLEISEVKTAAVALGIEIVPLDIRRAEDIGPAFDALGGRADALYVSTDPLIFSNITRINTRALGARLPTIYNGKEYIEFGGLMSYGPSYMKIDTPVATMGIRGTTPHVEIMDDGTVKFSTLIEEGKDRTPSRRSDVLKDGRKPTLDICRGC